MKGKRWIVLVALCGSIYPSLVFAVASFNRNLAAAQEANAQAESQRFRDNKDGTLTDTKTGLVWLKNANCLVFFQGDTRGMNSRPWSEAMRASAKLNNGFCGLSDQSRAGDWRLPNRDELLSLVQHNQANSGAQNGIRIRTQLNQSFDGIQAFYYWTSTVGDLYPDFSFYVSLAYGIDSHAFQMNTFNVLPVRSRRR
jgi:hypothetical protein